MNATITSVFPNVREWGGKFPDACSVGGLFDDGSQWEVATKIGSAAEKHIEALKALIGRECDFELEPKPDYQGQKQWKMKSYPGKPQGGQGGGGGGKGNWVPSYHQTAEGMFVEQERMDRRTALMQAVAAGTVKDWTPDQMYSWLRRTAGDKPAATPAPAPQSQERPVRASQGAEKEPDPFSPEFDDVPTYPAPVPASLTVNPIWEGPGQCQSCHAPAGRPHGRPCR